MVTCNEASRGEIEKGRKEGRKMRGEVQCLLVDTREWSGK
jgi:hypothetical protein